MLTSRYGWQVTGQMRSMDPYWLSAAAFFAGSGPLRPRHHITAQRAPAWRRGLRLAFRVNVTGVTTQGEPSCAALLFARCLLIFTATAGSQGAAFI
jgi:hypothetical protein